MARLDPKSILIETNYRLPHKEWQRQEEEQLEAAAEKARLKHAGDTVGELLRWPRADGYAVYMVTCEQPLMVAHVDVGDGYMVEAALIRGLRLATVQAMVERERKVRHHFEHVNDFYLGLEVGAIVHYHDGFGQYVRCEVVEAADDEACVHAGKGERCLKEVALVGNWKDYDLRSDSYHMKGVREGRLFKPNASNIWENPEFARHEGPRAVPDPTGLEPLALQGQQEIFAS